MPVNHRSLPLAPDRVLAVLHDGYSYADWVVGTQFVRDVQPGWPRPHTRLRHRSGLGSVYVQGDSEVLEQEHDRLVLIARAHGIGAARVDLRVEPHGVGSRVTMTEHVVEPRLLRGFNVFLAPFIWVRNAESLRRLGRRAAEIAAPRNEAVVGPG